MLGLVDASGVHVLQGGWPEQIAKDINARNDLRWCSVLYRCVVVSLCRTIASRCTWRDRYRRGVLPMVATLVGIFVCSSLSVRWFDG